MAVCNVFIRSKPGLPETSSYQAFYENLVTREPKKRQTWETEFRRELVAGVKGLFFGKDWIG